MTDGDFSPPDLLICQQAVDELVAGLSSQRVDGDVRQPVRVRVTKDEDKVVAMPTLLSVAHTANSAQKRTGKITMATKLTKGNV